MKLRTIGAVLAGAAMIGATVAGAAAAADAPAKSWFIDPATGQPNVTVVVGAQANASDVVSASLIAASVGNMATVEETASTTKTASVKWEKVGEYNYTRSPYNYQYQTLNCGSNRVATWYTDWALYSSQYWETAENNWPNKDYDTYVQLAMPSDVRNPTGSLVAKGLSTLWFSNSAKDWDSKDRVYKFGVLTSSGNTNTYYLVNTQVAGTPTAPIIRVVPAMPLYAGGSYDDGDGAWDFNTYGMFTTLAWVDTGVPATGPSFTADCDYNFGGTGTAMEAHEEIQLIVGDKYESDQDPTELPTS